MILKRKYIICVALILAFMVFIAPYSFAQCLGANDAVPTFNQVYLGSSGNTVKVVQRFMYDFAYGWDIIITGAGGIDGLFGDTTNLCVSTFQQVRGLTVDGVVGPYTWEQIRLFTYEVTTQYPSGFSQDHFGNIVTNYSCYHHGDTVWYYRHLSEGVIHFYYNGGNSLPVDAFDDYFANSYDYFEVYG